MAVKLICLDMDGTLLDEDHFTICPENLRAIRAALAAGVVVAPATGRIVSRLAEQLRMLPELSYAIVSNGGEVVNLHTGEILGGIYFSAAQALSLLSMIEAQQLPVMLYQGARMLISPDDLDRLQADPAQNRHLCDMLKLQTPVADFEQYLKEHSDRLQKFNLPRVPAEQRARLLQEWAQLPGIEVTTSLANNIEINPAGATKGAGLQLLCRRLSVNPADVMVIGDGLNDLSMFSVAGWPVAMGNAEASVKQAARLVTASNAQHGVADAIFAALEGRLSDGVILPA